MDDVTNVTLQLRADDPLPLDFPYEGKFASLVVRCRKARTDLYLVTDVPVKTSYDEDFDQLGTFVRYRLDGGKPEGSYWSEATDGEGAFSRSPISFARRLAHSKELILEFTPYNTASISVKFTVHGLSEVLPRVSDACHWHS